MVIVVLSFVLHWCHVGVYKICFDGYHFYPEPTQVCFCCILKVLIHVVITVTENSLELWCSDCTQMSISLPVLYTVEYHCSLTVHRWVPVFHHCEYQCSFALYRRVQLFICCTQMSTTVPSLYMNEYHHSHIVHRYTDGFHHSIILHRVPPFHSCTQIHRWVPPFSCHTLEPFSSKAHKQAKRLLSSMSDSKSSYMSYMSNKFWFSITVI